MAHRIIWTQTAADDLRSIVRYISAEDSEAARHLAERILAQINHLTEFPMAGRVVPEKADEHVREMQLSPYRIVYVLAPDQDVLFINRIWHAARGDPEI